MIRHILLFRLKPDAGTEANAILFAKLRELPSHFPAMQHYQLGENVSERDQTFSHAMTVTFDTKDELEAYLNSELHERMVRQYFAPIVEKRAIVSFLVS